MDYDNAILNALDKFDDIMVAVYELLNLKNWISESITKMTEGLKNLSIYKT